MCRYQFVLCCHLKWGIHISPLAHTWLELALFGWMLHTHTHTHTHTHNPASRSTTPTATEATKCFVIFKVSTSCSNETTQLTPVHCPSQESWACADQMLSKWWSALFLHSKEDPEGIPLCCQHCCIFKPVLVHANELGGYSFVTVATCRANGEPLELASSRSFYFPLFCLYSSGISFNSAHLW